MKNRSMTAVLIICVLSGVRCFALAPEKQLPPLSLGENLGESLLDDELDRLLLQELENELANVQPQTVPPHGDDAGQASGTAALESIRQKMQTASELLPQPNKLKRTQSLQQQAIAELDRLIQEAEQQKKRQSADKKKSESQQKSSQNKSAGKTAGQAPKNQAVPPKRSSNQIVTRTDRFGKLIKQAWGNLPERTRQQMLQSMEQDFLPKYQTELQEYFKSLSTDNRGDSNE